MTNKTTEISTAAQTQLATQSDQTFSLLQQAVQAGTSPEALEKLVALQERILDRNSQQEFAASMVRVQTKIKPVHKGTRNTQTNSFYAKLEDMHKEIAPIYTEEGFALLFAEGESPHESMRRIICDVMHRSGHVRQYHIDLPLDDRGIKGTPNKTGTHATLSTMSYGRRYLEAQIFGVVFTELDDDGNLGAVKKITAQQAADLIALADDVSADHRLFLKYIAADSFEAIPARDYDRAVAALEAKRAHK